MAFHLTERRHMKYLPRRQPIACRDGALVSVCHQIVMMLAEGVVDFGKGRAKFPALVKAIPDADGIEYVTEQPGKSL